MRRKICRRAALTLLLWLFLSLCACRKETPDAASVLRAVFAGYEESTAIYSARAGSLPEGEALSRLYGRKDAGEIFDALSDCALLLSKGECGFEAEILFVRHPSECGRVRGLLQSRLEMLRDPAVRRYLSEDYERFLASAAIYEEGNALILLSTGQNDETLEKIKAYVE